MQALRQLELKDLDSLRGWRNDRQLRNGTQGFRYPVTAGMEERWFRSVVEEGAPQRVVFAIQNDDGAFLGLAQLMDIDPIHRNAALGLLIGPVEERAKGHGRRALKELLYFAFSDLNLYKVHVRVNADNEHAIRLYESEGFLKEGRLKNHYFQNGEFIDVLLYGIMQNSPDK